MDEVDRARSEIGLSANRFDGAASGIPPSIVCRCIHCGALFSSRSADLADLDHICLGDCGCKARKGRS